MLKKVDLMSWTMQVVVSGFHFQALFHSLNAHILKKKTEIFEGLIIYVIFEKDNGAADSLCLK